MHARPPRPCHRPPGRSMHSCSVSLHATHRTLPHRASARPLRQSLATPKASSKPRLPVPRQPCYMPHACTPLEPGSAAPGADWNGPAWHCQARACCGARPAMGMSSGRAVRPWRARPRPASAEASAGGQHRRWPAPYRARRVQGDAALREAPGRGWTDAGLRVPVPRPTTAPTSTPQGASEQRPIRTWPQTSCRSRRCSQSWGLTGSEGREGWGGGTRIGLGRGLAAGVGDDGNGTTGWRMRRMRPHAAGRAWRMANGAWRMGAPRSPGMRSA